MSILPSDFVWGLGTASYQIEGAVAEDGRAPSIWDSFCQKPGRIADGSSGEIACDAYHKTAEDIALLRSYGARAYRFSISWSRVIPLGGRSDPINQKGLNHYVKFANDLVKAGIKPIITLCQWDLPEALQQRYSGPLNKDEFVADFSNYARVMFRALSHLVPVWFTFTEPFVIAIMGYNNGNFAPGRSSDRSKSDEGDSSRECWTVGHNLLLAHGAAVKIYREEHKPLHHGEIGLVLWTQWAEPWDLSDPKDMEAQSRFLDFNFQWFSDPIYLGDYPATMREQLGDRLPEWTPEEIALVKGSNDFFGLDYYTSVFVKHKSGGPPDVNDALGHLEVLQENSKGEPVGPLAQSVWLQSSPSGFRKLLNYLHRRYNTKIYVAENGFSVKGEDDLPLEEALNDEFRCQFYRDHVEALVKSRVDDGVDVGMYMAWSLLDNFEWADGYPTRFGLTYVDFKDNQKRYPKKSSRVLGELFAKYMSK